MTRSLSVFFFFNDTATTEIYTLSLHDALPICPTTHLLASDAHQPIPVLVRQQLLEPRRSVGVRAFADHQHAALLTRSEEHTSELQSRQYLVCRLLLEKKKELYLF